MRSLTVAVSSRRRAFTLIEMLVVIAIILILAAMIVAVAPGVSTRQQSYRGAGQLQGALLYARNRAKMNMLPTGITLSQDSNGNMSIIQFIQSGGDFTQGLASGQGIQVQLTVNTPLGTFNNGDYLEMAGSGLPHFIVNSNGGNTVILNGPGLQTAFTQPVTYRIMRSPRLLVGEEPVQMPQDVAFSQPYSAAFVNVQQGNCPTTILFSPSGALTGPSAGFDIVCFLVQDVNLPYGQGFPTIIAVYGKTGFITAHPVNVNTSMVVHGYPPQSYPFYFALNARSSGL